MPTIVERSVIDMGQGSYIITLPKPWIRYMGIKPGEKLEVIANGELVIRCKRRNKRRTKK
jgi:AbrB family looped-hinge helix DNA binding protein